MILELGAVEVELVVVEVAVMVVRVIQAGLVILVSTVMVVTVAIPTSAQQDDNGGLLITHLERRIKLERSGATIHIGGACLSACTLYLGARRYCVKPDAILGFHAASNAAGTRWLWRQYPWKVRRWLKARGGLGKRMLILRGGELRRAVRICKSER